MREKKPCEVSRCRSKMTEVVYFGHNVCLHCWMKHSNDKSDFDLKKIFKIEEGE